MYLLNAETEISWIIGKTATVIAYDDLDLVIIDPNGNITYTVSPIAEIDFTAPTPTVDGTASYLFTPDIEGLWKVRLVIGDSANYQILSKVELFVLDNTLTVNPIKNTPEGVSGAIEVSEDSVLLSSYITRLNFSGAQFTLTETGGIANIAIENYPNVVYQSQNDLLTAIFGALDESHLVQTLQNRINLIDQAGPGSVNERVLAVNTRADSLQASIEDPSTGLLALAGVNNSQAAWITDVNGRMISQAESIELFFAQVGDSYTAVEVHGTAISGLEGSYTVKVDVSGYVAGFGVASEPNEEGGQTSEFAIVADKFSIAPVVTNPNAPESATSPFYHITVETVVDGVTIPPGTYMKAAFIADATIGNAHIGNLIESEGADPVNGIGWRISKDGSIEATELIIRDQNGNIILQSTGSSAPTYNSAIDNTQQQWPDVVNRPADTTNLYNKASFEDESVGTWSGATVSAVTGQTFTWSKSQTVRDSLESIDFPVTVGETFYIRGFADFTGTTHAGKLGIAFRRADGSSFGWDGLDIAAGAGWQQYIGTVTVPADAVSAHGWTQIDASGTFGQVEFADLYMSRSAINLLAGRGVNICHPRYSVFEEDSLPPLAIASTGTVFYDTAVSRFGGASLRSNATGDNAFIHLAATDSDYNIKITPNSKWIISCWMRSNTLSAACQLRMKTSDGIHHYVNVVANSSATHTWKHVYGIIDLSSNSSTTALARVDNDGGAGVSTWFDGLMIEEQVGTLEKPSNYSMPGQSLEGYEWGSDGTEATLKVGTTIDNGGITLDGGGVIKAGKTSAASTIDGFWLGHDEDSNYDFHIGNATQSLWWNGSLSTLTITGEVLSQGIGSSGERIEINAGGNNEVHFYGDRGDATVEELANIGINTGGGYDPYVAVFGTTSVGSNVFGVLGRSYSGTAVYGHSLGNVAVKGYSEEESLTGIGVQGNGRYGMKAVMNSTTQGGNIIFFPGSTSAPTHTAAKGTLYVLSNASCAMYINQNGSTSWRSFS